MTDEQRTTTANSGLAKGGASCFVETFVKVSTFLFRMNFSAKNPALRQAAKRYPKGGVSCSKDSFVVNGSLDFQIKFCGINPALLVAANR